MQQPLFVIKNCYFLSLGISFWHSLIALRFATPSALQDSQKPPAVKSAAVIKIPIISAAVMLPISAIKLSRSITPINAPPAPRRLIIVARNECL